MGVHSSACLDNRCVWDTQEILEKEFDEAEALEDEDHGDGGEAAAELEIEEAVFMSSYIPRSLHEVLAVTVLLIV